MQRSAGIQDHEQPHQAHCNAALAVLACRAGAMARASTRRCWQPLAGDDPDARIEAVGQIAALANDDRVQGCCHALKNDTLYATPDGKRADRRRRQGADAGDRRDRAGAGRHRQHHRQQPPARRVEAAHGRPEAVFARTATNAWRAARDLQTRRGSPRRLPLLARRWRRKRPMPTSGRCWKSPCGAPPTCSRPTGHRAAAQCRRWPSSSNASLRAGIARHGRQGRRRQLQRAG